ncbi:MAG: hypothetical protein RBG13Loki_2805 [Promethearchaeota archaeon CR_4]|nr:MAG: hypothetical protein RBG13Loki_2805 [Candidatus Lokiarchaeota archaeon CR_4]
MQKHGDMPFFELDALTRGTFLQTVEQIFDKVLASISKEQ